MWTDGIGRRLHQGTASHWSQVSRLPAGEHLSEEVTSFLLAPKMCNHDLPAQAADVRDEVFKIYFLVRQKATAFISSSVLIFSHFCLGKHPCVKSRAAVACYSF